MALWSDFFKPINITFMAPPPSPPPLPQIAVLTLILVLLWRSGETGPHSNRTLSASFRPSALVLRYPEKNECQCLVQTSVVGTSTTINQQQMVRWLKRSGSHFQTSVSGKSLGLGSLPQQTKDIQMRCFVVGRALELSVPVNSHISKKPPSRGENFK